MHIDGSDQHPITSFDYDSDAPSWSPDGQWIFFTSNREGNYDIYKMRWDGSDISRLTTDPRKEYWPRMSPNGLQIVYSVEFGADNYYQLFVMNADGSDSQNISNSQMGEYLASWSPDSRWLVYSYCRGPNSPADLRCEIYRINADGSEQRPIMTTANSEIRPAISPDGSVIAFTANVIYYPELGDDTSNNDILLVNPDGTNIRRVTTNPEADSDAAWSPDGSRIIFRAESEEGGGYDIWVISVTGQNLFRLTSLPGNEAYPVWQP